MGILSNAEPECQSHRGVGSEKHRRHHHTHERGTLLLIFGGTVDSRGIMGVESLLCAKRDYYSDRGKNFEGQRGTLFQKLCCFFVDFDEEGYVDPERDDDEGDTGGRNKCQ